MESTRCKPSYETLWLEYKIAAQYPEVWDRAADNVELIRLRESQGTLPVQADASILPPSGGRIRSAVYWMQQVDVPRWFIVDELGIGTPVNYHRTQATLQRENRKRELNYRRELSRLERARAVLRRTCRW